METAQAAPAGATAAPPVASNPEEIIKEKMTLRELLAVFTAVDDGLIQLDIDQMKDVAGKLALKIDDYKAFIERCDVEEKRLKIRADHFSRAQKEIKETKNRVQKMMMFHLGSDAVLADSKGKKRLSGEDWNVMLKVAKGNRTTIDSKMNNLLNAQNFVKYGASGLMTKSYAWNSTELKKAKKAESLPEELDKFVKLEDSESLSWSVRKGIES